MVVTGIVEDIRKARFVWVCGNGGSAATAEHFTNDLFSKGIRAFCLNSNTSIMTMIANDFGYEFVFSKQLDLYANDDDDLLIAFSVSGESPNILNAITGRKHLLVRGEEGESYQTAEDRHLKLAHQISKAI
jgi:D-sedoheptulose 7-phosphate isomerase